MILFLLNVSFVAEEPIYGGDLGEATITCSGKDYGRCLAFSLDPCEFDMYTQTTLQAHCIYIGRPEYYCSRMAVMAMNFICSPFSW